MRELRELRLREPVREGDRGLVARIFPDPADQFCAEPIELWLHGTLPTWQLGLFPRTEPGCSSGAIGCRCLGARGPFACLLARDADSHSPWTRAGARAFCSPPVIPPLPARESRRSNCRMMVPELPEPRNFHSDRSRIPALSGWMVARIAALT